MTLFFDTETTGKAIMNGDPKSKQQPHIVQLAAILTDEDDLEVMSMNVIIKPDGWEIPAEASAIHGITTEFASKVGIHIEDALYAFSGLKRSADEYCAHNIDFDRFMIMSEVMRNEKMTWNDGSMPVERCFCTMRAMTPICQLPGQYGDFKWPKLIEAHRHAFMQDFDGAHDALADVRACARIRFWLRDVPRTGESTVVPEASKL